MLTVRYLVDNTDEAVSFYTQQMGFTLEERMGPAFAVVSREGLRLWLAGPQSSAARPMPDGRKPEPGGWNRLVVEVPDIQTETTRLRDAGVRFRGDIVHGPGGSQIVLEDPSGNAVEIFQPA